MTTRKRCAGLPQCAFVRSQASSSPSEFDAAFRAACARVFVPGAAAASQPHVALDWIDSPVGPLILGATPEAICLLEFSELETLDARLTSLRHRTRAHFAVGTNRWLAALRVQLGEYFAAERRDFSLPLTFGGSDFQHRVWSLLREIPYGQTWSYRDLAERVGDLSATRAVGAANGMNPIAIVIPCHRVIYANGDPGGFGGGLWRKQILLDLERGQARLDF